MSYRLCRPFLYLGTLAFVAVLCGCGPQGASYNKRYFILDTARADGPAGTNGKFILDVRRFTIDTAFESKGLVYRKGQLEHESDFYNEFLISPAVMITEKTRTWLSQSGLFTRVLDPGSRTEPTHTLEGNITALYGDFRAKSAPKAVMEIRVFLIAERAQEGSIVLGKTYRTSLGVKSQDAKGLVEAFSQCLEIILTSLEKDLAESVL